MERYAPFRRPTERRNVHQRVPDELLWPTKIVVKEAGRLVKLGIIDSFKSRKVVVVDPVSGHMYQIVNLMTKRLEATMNRGLFVHPVEIGEGGRIVHEQGIQIPRDPKAVNRETIVGLYGISPQIMEMVAHELKRAEIVHLGGFPERPDV